MTYRRLPDGTHAIGFTYDRRFIAYASAYDAREAKALVKALRSVLDLFHATSGGWVTIGPGGKVIPRGSSANDAKKKRTKNSN